MRVALLCCLLAVVGCTPRHRLDFVEEEPPGPMQLAARITYDPVSHEFTLTNTSNKVFWYLEQDHCPVCDYQQLTAEGWVWVPSGRWCATGEHWQPLDPGQCVGCGAFPRKIVNYRREVQEEAERGGNPGLLPLPARLCVEVLGDRDDGWSMAELVYSESVVPVPVPEPD